MTILVAENASRYRAATLAGATDLFLVPVLQGTVHWLRYVDGVLDKASVPDKGVRPVRDLRGLAILEHEPVLHVRCTFNKGQYWAQEVRVDDGGPQDHAPLTRVLQMHLLHMKAVPTVLPLCSWATVCGVEKDGSAKRRDLPLRRADAEALFEQRLKELNEVRTGKRQSYWQNATLFARKKAPLRMPPITSLEVAEAVGVEFDAPAGDLPRLW
jgi:hypothetical protein